ncbi:MAG: ABC transporter permease [Candidatus Riflebacteria bacterium]|nr:ABC transporter permease [Candidatus Riflebacteria bacterium]
MIPRQPATIGRPELALFLARFRTLVQYRAAAAAGFVTQLFWGVIRLAILAAFIDGAPAASPMTPSAIIAYVWLSQACFAMLPWNLDPEILALVRSGNVAGELVRPLGLYRQWFCRCLAARTAPPLLRGIPLLAIAWTAGDLPLPAGVATAAAWLAALAGAALLCATFATLMNVCLLFTLSGDGINGLMAAVVTLGSGLILPLPFLPDGWQRVLEILPFRGMVDAPFRLYGGDLPLTALGSILAHQAAWILILGAAGWWLCRAAERRMTVQGG